MNLLHRHLELLLKGLSRFCRQHLGFCIWEFIHHFLIIKSSMAICVNWFRYFLQCRNNIERIIRACFVEVRKYSQVGNGTFFYMHGNKYLILYIDFVSCIRCFKNIDPCICLVKHGIMRHMLQRNERYGSTERNLLASGNGE